MADTSDDRAILGARGEDLACEMLERAGLEIVARNWRVSSGPVRGELDIVALDHVTAQVVVCEVKTRRGEGFGGPIGAVTRRKQTKIRQLALAFLSAAELPYRGVRFDVVGIVWGSPPHVRHLAGAF